jgi:hypothetical protein
VQSSTMAMKTSAYWPVKIDVNVERVKKTHGSASE